MNQIINIAFDYATAFASQTLNNYTNEKLTNGSMVMIGFLCFRIFVVLSSYLMFPTMNVFVRLFINFAWPKFVGATLEGLGVMAIFRRKTAGYRTQVSQLWTNFWTGPSFDFSELSKHQMFLPAMIAVFLLAMTMLESFAAQKFMLVASYLLEMFFGSRAEKLSVQWMCFLDRTAEDRAVEKEVQQIVGKVVAAPDVLTPEMFLPIETVPAIVAQKAAKEEFVFDVRQLVGKVVAAPDVLSEKDFEEL